MTTEPDQPRRGVRPLLRPFLRRTLSLAALLLVACAAYLAWDAWNFLHGSPETPGKDITVEIEPGATLAAAAAQLQNQGAITNALRFRILARLQGKDQKIQAGRFLVHTGWTPQTVLDQLVSGRAMLFRVTVPEGRPWWEVARIMEDAGMCTAKDFEATIHDPEFLRHYGIPFASAEGFLYPDTYLMPHPRELDERAARAAAGRMIDTFWKRAAPLWPERPAPQTLRDAVTLASIVEKETGVPSERGRVAGVYANRLRKNMLLQADPTVIYGLGPSFDGPLLRRQLEDAANPYNTYQKAGLPPGPICSPGIAALKAAVAPEKHNFYYFVATGTDGGHTFSATLTEHNRAVQIYRAAMRRGGGGTPPAEEKTEAAPPPPSADKSEEAPPPQTPPAGD